MRRTPSLQSPLCLLICMGVLIMLLTGCWNRRELNELAVVLVVGIDSADGQYEVSVQVAEPSQMSRNRGSDRSSVSVFSQKASTIFEAFRKITTKSARKMYLAHIRLVIFDEQTARKGIKEPLDFLFRDHEVRPDFYMVVTKGTSAKDVVSFITPTEMLPSIGLYKTLKVSEKVWAPTSAVKVTEMMKKLTKIGVEPVLTWGEIVGDVRKGKTLENVKQPTRLSEFKYFGVSVFRGDQLVGWLNESDSKAYNYITNKVSSTVGSVKCPQSESDFVVEVTRSKVKIVPSVHNKEPRIQLDATIEANLGESGCPVGLNNEAIFLAMEEAAREDLRKILKDGVREAQSMGSDIFGFGEAFHRKYPRQWSKWKANWNQIFKKMPVEIMIDYKLRKNGKIINTFGENPTEKE
ncbi:Ger(x)C family spore germination protein [Paenibacillus sp. Soil750]|uniref:Ger(x)C family spore germination protein n=1 Tax=Paenibacillus sp. Soil750 TaxID=1736398 RepID=UPI0006FC409A|nr:Ger(x)C family spore germination protein [Paenibacillus sp. Soil750]KRE72923.1 spore gernimation protein GerC [Paenibacillus sp. Soil750]